MTWGELDEAGFGFSRELGGLSAADAKPSPVGMYRKRHLIVLP
jgi:hypothetical protein